MVIVTKAVKEYVSSKGMQTGSEIPAELEKLVYELLNRAIERAKSNGRKTITSKDL